MSRYDIAADDLHPEAGVQYYALALIEEMNRKGWIEGRIPRTLLSTPERQLLERIKRDKSGLHAYTDTEIEGAVVWAVGALHEQGYKFNIDIARNLGKIANGE
jgi:hypothetical protein